MLCYCAAPNWFDENGWSFQARITSWKQTAFWFRLLRDSKKLIPSGVDIPLEGETKVRLNDEPALRLLGEQSIKVVEDWHQKVLMDISLVRSDPEYIDQIRATVSRRSAIHRLDQLSVEITNAKDNTRRAQIILLEVEKITKRLVDLENAFQDVTPSAPRA